MRQPNVIVVLCDMMRACEVGCYGNTFVRTPHLDRLAETGVRFETAVTNNPACTPARSCLLSGQYSRTCTGNLGNDADDPPTMTRTRLTDATLAECFRDAGYHTALIGKWHIHPHPQTVGFQQALFPRVPHRYYGQTYYEDGREFTVDGFAPAFEMERVTDYLAAHREEPFFLFYNISPPHMPLGLGHAPAHYTEMYDPAVVLPRLNVLQEGRLPHSEFWFQIYTIWDRYLRWNEERATDELPAGFDLRHLIAAYDGMVTCVDDLVGQLTALLETYGLAEDTLLLFTSDHGDNLGSHGLFNKDVLYEESIRIPFILSKPGMLRAHTERTAIAQLIDVMPTLLELCGLDTPGTVQGRSLVPALHGHPVPGENAAFIETDPSQYGHSAVGIRTRTHLYGMALAPGNRAIENPALHFFDLDADPYQLRNLAGTSEQAATAAALRARLQAWQEETRWHGE
jgi:arylsulfatase A-like enzyme